MERLDHRSRAPCGNHRLNPAVTITPANIRWRGDQPSAADFDDIYFSADGIQETLRVFIEPSDILRRAEQQSDVCVAELGFGTGLNFAVLAREMLAQGNTRLHFICFEKYPLRQADWDTVAKQRRADLPIYNELAAQAPPLLSGWHQRVFAGGQVILQVYHGDVAAGLTDLAERQPNPVDAWFLDGFAPSKNPQMWAPELFANMARLARRDTTVSTFTAAGHVRRGLQHVGFEMRKVDQQAYKRESLAGRFSGDAPRSGRLTPSTAVVHGAGMAGAFTARHLAEAGVAVTVFDPNGIAQGASAMSATVLHSRLLGDRSVNAEWRCSAFHYASTYLRRFSGFTPSGVMWIQGPNLDATKLERISTAYDATNPNQHPWLQHLSAAAATQHAATPIAKDALFHPTGGVVNAAQLCRALLAHPGIEVVAAAGQVSSEQPNIICAATDTRRFAGCELLEITNVYGQLDWYASPNPLANMPVVGNGYLVPTDAGGVLGASYENTAWHADDATAHNLQLNQHLLGEADLNWQRRMRRARCVSSDRTPVVGRLDVAETPQPLWVHTGLGSMGTTAGALAAASISAEILGWLPPLAASVAELMRPGRFKARQARRGVRHIKPLPPLEP